MKKSPKVIGAIFLGCSLLMGCAADVTPNQRLISAVAHEKAQNVANLVKDGADPNQRLPSKYGMNPIIFSPIGSKNEATLIALLECGADPNATFTPEVPIRPLDAVVAIWDNEEAIVRVASKIIASGGKSGKNKHGDTALHWAAAKGYCRVISLLLTSDKNPDPVDDNGRTPLFHALAFKHADAAVLLIQSGADGNHRANNGSTAIGDALTQRSIEKFNTSVGELLKTAKDKGLYQRQPLDNAQPASPAPK